MVELKDVFQEKLSKAKKKLYRIKKKHGNEDETPETFEGGFWEGEVTAYQNIVDKINEFERLSCGGK